jgi:predicted PurR-regulated permease PerM
VFPSWRGNEARGEERSTTVDEKRATPVERTMSARVDEPVGRGGAIRRPARWPARENRHGATLSEVVATGRLLPVSLTLLLLVSLFAVPYVWLLLFAAILLAVLLDALTSWASRLSGWSREWSYAFVLAALTATCVLLVAFAVPQLRDQVQRLSEQLPAAWEQVQSRLDRTAWGETARRLLPSPEGRWQSLGTTSAGALSSTFGVMADLVVLVFVGVYLAADPDRYAHGMTILFPRGLRPRVRQWLDTTGTTLRRWLGGRSLLMLLNAVATAIGLWILGIPLPILLGLLSGLLNFIPNFGPILAAVPAVLLGFSVDMSTALYVALFYLGYQMFDGYVLTPLVQQRTVSLPPALTIMSQVLLGVLLGPWGVVLAVPLAAVGVVSVKMLYLEDVLDEHVHLPGDSCDAAETGAREAG